MHPVYAYANHLINITSTLSEQTRRKLQDELLSATGFAQQLGQNVEYIEKQNGPFIISCHFMDMDAYGERWLPCSKHANINIFSVPSLFNCNRIQVNQSTLPDGATIAGIDLALYLNNGHGITMPFRSSMPKSMGAIIAATSPDSWPDFGKDHILLSPGHLVRVECMWLKWHIMTSSNGNLFRVTGILCEEFTGHWWIPSTNASDAELW